MYEKSFNMVIFADKLRFGESVIDKIIKLGI